MFFCRRDLLYHLLVFLCISHLQAQTYPAAITTAFQGPRTLFLDEYANSFQPKIRATIYFTDFAEPSWTFSLRLKITGPNGIMIRSKANIQPPAPIVVSPGQPYTLEGADLSYYFNYNHLDFTGISRSQLEINNRLPEGLYTFCFEAVDYESSRPLSLPGCATAYLSLNDPPVIISPVKAGVVENISMQNILLQWQLLNAGGNIDHTKLNYQIDLYEVNNAWSNPLNAIINQQAVPVWRSELLTQNTYIYGITDPPLDKGKRYVFTVRAIEPGGRSSFKNDGYSSPSFFHYGYYEGDTIPLINPQHQFQFSLSTPSEFKWNKPPKSLPNQLISYQLRLVEIDSEQSADEAMLENSAFYQQEYLPNHSLQIGKTIPVMVWTNIKPMQRYAWQVTGKSGTQQVAESEVYEFTGPPAIENFIAGGFLMTITKLSSFDTVNNRISGKCRTVLQPSVQTEFSFHDISIGPIGNNEWVMTGGLIKDKISLKSYTLEPEDAEENNTAEFFPDSVIVNTAGLLLSGRTEWKFPHATPTAQPEKLVAPGCKLTLANVSYHLNNNQPLLLGKKHVIPLLDPYGFVFNIDPTSSFSIYQSRYRISLNGFMKMPGKVKDLAGTDAQVAFNDIRQVHYFEQKDNLTSEEIRLTERSSIGFLPVSYIFDLDESRSPGKLQHDSLWKGLYVAKAQIRFPKKSESSGQISLPFPKTFLFENTAADSNLAHISTGGLDLRSTTSFQSTDSLKFNTFNSSLGYFYNKIKNSEIDEAYITGAIQIPLLDTVQGFPYHIEMTDFGFNEGYLKNGLAGHSFTFNASGAPEQRIPIKIKRAVFRNHDRLEMDLDLQWPHFGLQLPGVSQFMVWGNGNIGFDVPNGKVALPYQASGKAGNFDITVDHLGCGRNGNAYAFGASAKINMDEEISGENGPPVVNAYSLYKNPLLRGQVYIPPPSNSSLTATGSSVTTNSYQSSTSGYTQAIAANLEGALTQMGHTTSDSLTMTDGPGAADPLLNANTVLEIRQVVEILYLLKPYIKSKSVTVNDWLVLDRIRNVLDGELVQQAQTTNAKDVLNFALNKAVETIIEEINGSIQNLSDKAMSKVRTAINGKIVGPVNSRIDKSLTSVFDKLEQRICAQVDEQYHQLVKEAFGTVRTNVIQGINTSVSNSFETNITGKITNFVQLGVTARVKTFVRAEVGAAGRELIDNGVNAKINLDQILSNSGALLAGIADTVKDVIVNANAATFINTAESLVDDAISGIDWNAIGNQIVNDLLQKGVSSVIAGPIMNMVGTSAGPYAAAVLNNVKFDFTNLGEKLQNGEFDKIVKFDPTSIYLETPAADIRGCLKFTKDDPVYGDSWQADVLVRVKVPKKDNPIEITAFFLNGKTTQQPQNFTYWFAKLSVTGFTIPLNPVPVIWYGVEGFAYSKMKRNTPTQVVPDMTNKFGIGAKFYFYDQQSAGKTYLFDLGAEAEFNDGGFYVQLVGNASVFNYQKTNGKYSAPGFVTGTGTLGFYKTPEYSKIAANFSVKLNTAPIICAGGDVGMDLRTPNDWKIWAGTQQNPIGVKILCKDFLSNTAFMQASNSGFTTGLGMNVALSAQSPWIKTEVIKIRGFANLNFGYSAFASVEWDPTFKINEASISAWASASIGIDYETEITKSSLTLAGVALAGSLTYKSSPESELHGEMSGSITVLGYSLGFNTPVHYSLSRQEILN